MLRVLHRACSAAATISVLLRCGKYGHPYLAILLLKYDKIRKNYAILLVFSNIHASENHIDYVAFYMSIASNACGGGEGLFCQPGAAVGRALTARPIGPRAGLCGSSPAATPKQRAWPRSTSTARARVRTAACYTTSNVGTDLYYTHRVRCTRCRTCNVRRAAAPTLRIRLQDDLSCFEY